MIAFYFRQSKKIPLLLVLLFVRPLIAEKRLGGGEERNPIDLRNSSIGGKNEGICSARYIPTGSDTSCIAAINSLSDSRLSLRSGKRLAPLARVNPLEHCS